MSRTFVLTWLNRFFLFGIVLILSISLLQGLTASAQDVIDPAPTEIPSDEPPPVEEPPEETPVTPPEELLGLLFSLIKDATYIVWASAGVVVIVGLLKTVFKFSGSTAVLVTLVVQVAVWLGYAIANYFGAGEVFQKNYLILVDIGRSLLPLAGAIFGSRMLYNAAAQRSVPVLGFRVNH